MPAKFDLDSLIYEVAKTAAREAVAEYVRQTEQQTPVDTATESDVDDEALLSSEQAAGLLGLAPSTLAKGRVTGNSPPYLKLGRAVRYRKPDVLAWARRRQCRNTGQTPSPDSLVDDD